MNQVNSAFNGGQTSASHEDQKPTWMCHNDFCLVVNWLATLIDLHMIDQMTWLECNLADCKLPQLLFNRPMLRRHQLG